MKNLKFIVLSFILMFCFNTNVLAIDCYYHANDGSEIKVILQDNGLGDLYPNANSTNYNYVYPLNGIYRYESGWINKRYTFQLNDYNSGFKGNNSSSNYQEACPATITNYYTNTPFDTFLKGYSNTRYADTDIYLVTYFDKAYTSNSSSPDAQFNQTGTLGENVLSNCFSGNNRANWCEEIIQDSYKNKIYSLNKTKTFGNSGDSGNNNGYIECKYRNTKGTYVLFHFQKNEYTHKYWVGTSSITASGTGQTSGNNAQLGYSTCPATVYFPLGNSEKSTFITPTTCAAEEENCYYREDVDFTYSDNASTIFHYSKFLNSNESITIKVLKVTDSNGDAVKAYINGKEEVTISNMSEFKDVFASNTDDKGVPKYILKNGNTYEFANSKDGVNAEDTYMYVKYLLQVVLDSDNKVEATCRKLLGDDFLEFLNDNVFRIIYIAVPILLIVLTSFDFAKVVFVDDKEGIQGAFKKFGKRAVAAVLIYFVPTILIFIVNLLGASEVEQCAQAIKNITEQTNSN